MYTSTVHISYISQSLMICRTSRKTLPYLFNFINVMLQWLPFFFYFLQVIGKNQVSVPTHLYKVIMVENDQSELLGLGAFVIPNQPIGFEHKLQEFQIDLKDLEKSVGVIFTPKLDTHNVQNLCEINSCELMKREQFELDLIERRLQGARTLKNLENVWSDLKKNQLIPDEYLMNLYNTKKLEFKMKNNEE